MLANEEFELYKNNESFRESKKHFDELIEHWREIAKK